MRYTVSFSLFVALLSFTLLSVSTGHYHASSFDVEDVYVRDALPESDAYPIVHLDPHEAPGAQDDLDEAYATLAELERRGLGSKLHYFWDGATKLCKKCKSLCMWAGKGDFNIPMIGKGMVLQNPLPPSLEPRTKMNLCEGDKYKCPTCGKEC